MPQEKLREIEAKIAANINQSYRYDVKVSLVEVPGGGYNVVVYNRRPHTDLRGVCDPSFIAWQVADATSNSSWKSRNLHIWLKPYLEGWGLSTRGGRDAVSHARSRSPLGWAGVLDAPSFRKWLEKEFRPLPTVPMGPHEIAPAKDVANATPQLQTRAATLSPIGLPALPPERPKKAHRHRTREEDRDDQENSPASSDTQAAPESGGETL